MAKLIYSAITSLDGYISDEQGNFDWAAPNEEVHAFANDLERSIGTHLYGRRMYETMVYWETAHTLPESDPVELDYAEVWQSADKIIYSTTMDQVSSARTRIERDFDPESIRQLKRNADRDLGVGGAEFAGHVIKAGLVDEYQLFVNPVLVGGGTSALPDMIRLDLELVDERRFGNGVVYLHYRSAATQSVAS
jgi:dihydrofolate reductase